MNSDATRDERPWALVSGASGGLGQAFSRYLASCAVNLILTGRRHDVLNDLAGRLTTRYGIQTIVHPCDISSASQRLALIDDIAGRGIVIDTLINNAGFGAAGRISETDPVRQTSQVEVNCEAVVHLCGLLLPGMIAAKQGSIINVASTAAFQPIPQFATYAASKSFVLSFTRALWAETNGTGVRTTAICPGPTDTGFFDVAGVPRMGAGTRRDPDDVVRTAFNALAHHRPYAVDGFVNRTVARLAPHLPARLVMTQAEKYLQV